MDRSKITVRGLHAPTPRLTVLGAALIAVAVALPAGGVIWIVEAIVF